MSVAFDNELRELGGGFLPVSPQIEFLYRIVVHCDSPIDVGNTGGKDRRIIPITGGRFEGPHFNGAVLPLGADWNSSDTYDPGIRTVDTRYVLKTDDGAVISLSTRGFCQRSPEIVEKRAAGEVIDPASYYFSQHLFFETGDKRYSWLNGVVAFGIVMSKFKGGPGVIYDAYYLK